MVHALNSSDRASSSSSGLQRISWEDFDIGINLLYPEQSIDVSETRLPTPSTYYTRASETDTVAKLYEFIIDKLESYTEEQLEHMEELDIVFPDDIIKIRVHETPTEWHELPNDTPLGHYTWRQGKMEKNRLMESVMLGYIPVIDVFLAPEAIMEIFREVPPFSTSHALQQHALSRQWFAQEMSAAGEIDGGR